MNPKSILNLFSVLILFFSFSFVFPIFISIIFNDDAFYIFLKTFISISLVGVVGLILTRNINNELSQKDGFVIIVMFWVVLSFAGSIPFYLSGMSIIDSFFESMSGITTTGATVISNIDALPESILFYRQMLQWMGGMGLIVLAIAVMPLLGIGGGQIYQQALSKATTLEITRVEGIFEADTFFPEIDFKKWKLVKKTNHPKDERHATSFQIETWVKSNSLTEVI